MIIFVRRILLLASLLFVILGVLFRYAGTQGELWLDEVYSLELISPLTSPWQVFGLAEDNNHFLNSLWMFELGPDASAAEYRLPSFLCSILTLLLGIRIAASSGPLNALFASILLSLSYVLTLYGSEARGYSSMLLCAAASFYLFERYRRSRETRLLIGFWLTSIGGVLSHFVFIHFYAALLVLTAALWIRRELRSLAAVAALHLPPLFGIGYLLLSHISALRVAGGPQGSRLEVLLNALSVPFGAPELSPASPESSLISLAAAILVLGILCCQVVRLHAERNPLAWFYGTLVIAIPILLVGVFEPQVFVVRYVLPSIFFSYFLAADFLARLFQQGNRGRVLSVVLVALFIMGNQIMLMQLSVYGRGTYTQALRFIAEHSDAERIKIGGDQDFRNSLLVEFHATQAGLDRRFEYIPGQFPDATEASWIIEETQDRAMTPEAQNSNPALVYAETFESAALSGSRWFIYCRKSDCPPVLRLR